MKRRCNRCKVVYDTNDRHYCKKGTTYDKDNMRYYNSKEWKVLRDYILSIHGYCARCGDIHSTLDMHHIIKINSDKDKEHIYNINNIVPLCKSCHKTVDNKCKSGTLDFEWEGIKQREYSLV